MMSYSNGVCKLFCDECGMLVAELHRTRRTMDDSGAERPVWVCGKCWEKEERNIVTEVKNWGT